MKILMDIVNFFKGTTLLKINTTNTNMMLAEQLGGNYCQD